MKVDDRVMIHNEKDIKKDKDAHNLLQKSKNKISSNCYNYNSGNLTKWSQKKKKKLILYTSNF